MSDPHPRFTETDRIGQAAYAWVQREHDGLSAGEAAKLHAWLTADPRHASAFEEYKRGWDRFADFARSVISSDPEPDLGRFAPSREAEILAAPSYPSAGRVRRLAPYLAAAAALAIGFFLLYRGSATRQIPASPAPLALPKLCEQRALADGSVVELNRGSDIRVDFTDSERRVRLLRGEANFTVARNPNRPFIVEAGAVQVRAVGTVFNVRYDAASVNVIVSEGKVRVDAPRASAATASERPPSYVEAGQKAVIPLAASSSAPEVVNLAHAQLEEELLWQPKLLDFDNAPLRDIVAEFNRRNPVHLIVDSDAMGARRMTASFRSDNVQGFVRLLESDFAIRAERSSDREIHLTPR